MCPLLAWCPTTYSSVNKIRILRKNIKYNMPWSAMVTVRIFICFAFELNVLRFLLSRCRSCSRCFCWHIQSKMKQLKRQLVSMKPTRGLTSFAMNFLLEYGKGAGDGALLVPSPNSNNVFLFCRLHTDQYYISCIAKVYSSYRTPS